MVTHTWVKFQTRWRKDDFNGLTNGKTEAGKGEGGDPEYTCWVFCHPVEKYAQLSNWNMKPLKNWGENKDYLKRATTPADF